MDGRVGSVVGSSPKGRSGVWRLWALPEKPKNKQFMHTISRSYTKIDTLKTSSGVKT